jgi:hypothetical protein
MRSTILALLIAAAVHASARTEQVDPAHAQEVAPAQSKVEEWRPLFDGKSLAGWKETPFTGRGKVTIQKGTIILGTGYMTGITYTKQFPLSNYEVRYEAARLEGSDFFASITFPVKDTHCTWVLGGWGGSLVGLSSLNGMDASENETSTDWTFQRGRYYRFRLRVTDDRITGWIDDDYAVDVLLQNRTIGLRYGEIELSRPLGIASWSTTGAVRNIEVRTLTTP